MHRALRHMVCCCAMTLTLVGAAAQAQLRGHGGPVRAVAISGDGGTALSGSFDASAILWSLRSDAAEQVLRVHEGAVNAVAMLQDGRIVTGGEDGRIAVWTRGRSEPDGILAGHTAPIVGLAVSPDGSTLASASWDCTIRLWSLAGQSPRVLEGHQANVNGVAFAPDGSLLVSVGYDATVRIWSLQQPAPPVVTSLPTALNAVSVAPDGEIVAAGADGNLHFLSPRGEAKSSLELSATPIIALALSRDGARIAAVAIGGPVAIVDRTSRHVARKLTGPGLPAWSAAFLSDQRVLVTGGADGAIRRWDVESGEAIGASAPDSAEDPLAAYAGDPGAQVFRACVACHTLGPGQPNRAGPSLHGLVGRRVATLPGYNYSPALKQLDIVWTPETVAKLFEIGPALYLPGTKMPEQRIGNPEDRDALVRFLERATR
jgi:cytochrome c